MNLGYTYGVYDVLRAEDLKQLDKQIQLSREAGNTHFALGIYEEELARIKSGSTPLKSIEDRMKIAEQLRGVDFVFSLPSLDENIIRKSAIEALKNKQEKDKAKEEIKKEYNIGYVPGTFDLFHAGHLENLLIADNNCESLVLGVKADDLVMKQKNRKTIMPEEERAEVLKHFKFVKDVLIFYTRNFNVANEMIKEKYGEGIGAVFVGSDLAKDYANIKDVNIIFTDRDEQLMKTRSTTHYRTLYLSKDHKDEKYVSNELKEKVDEVREKQNNINSQEKSGQNNNKNNQDIER